MRHLDFTINFETCSTSANAAVMQVAVVPWMRDNIELPFVNDNDLEPYVGYVDLRTCVVDGFDFDPDTIKWWAGRSVKAREAVLEGCPEPIDEVLLCILDYIREAVRKYHINSICLWSQGSDFDIAILRNLCRKYDVTLEEDIPHTSFRDCRTVILEAALIRCSVCGDTIATTQQEILAEPSKAYTLYDPLPEEYAAGREAHDALYDALRSTWNTWQALRWLRNNSQQH